MINQELCLTDYTPGPDLNDFEPVLLTLGNLKKGWPINI